MDIQRVIGADIIMAFDECCPGDADRRYAQRSMELTHRWLDRCLSQFNRTQPLYGYRQVLFPIVQGCQYADLRRKSAEYIAERATEGCAIGGLAVGEPTEVMYEMVSLCCDILPKDQPRYLMGVGTPANILEAIARGVDMFDCVMPTRNGRNGMLFTPHGTINIKNKKWETCFEPVSSVMHECACGNDSTDPSTQREPSIFPTSYTLAYLHHLMRAEEILALQICSIHNLAFYLWLVRTAREHILAGDFVQWKSRILPNLMKRL